MNNKLFDRELIIAIIVVITSTILTYKEILTPTQYLSIISAIISYYLGKTREKRQTVILGLAPQTTLEKMLNRLGIILLTSGVALVFEHTIHYGYTWDVELVCHGLYGIILTVLGWIIGSKIWKKLKIK